MTEILKRNYVFLNQDFTTKEDVFNFIAKSAVELKLGDSIQPVFDALKNREIEASTGLQDGIAIPHAISKSIQEPAVLFIRSNNDIQDWETFDDSKVNQIIAMLVPENSENEHLQVLSNIATNLIDDDKRQELLRSNTIDQILNILNN